MKSACAALAAGLLTLSTLSSATAQTAPALDPSDPIARIRDEGMNHSQVMETLSYLCDVIGPRLTGSPNLKHANEWTRDKMTSWGLVNAHLEGWQFGRGWALKRFSAEVVEPYTFPLTAAPKAWSPGLKKPVVADVVYLDVTNVAGLEKYKGKLKGAIVLTSPVLPVREHFEPVATRQSESNLLAMANATSAGGGRGGRGGAGGTNAAAFGGRGGRGGGGGTNAAAFGAPGRRGGRGGGAGGMQGQILAFLLKENAALALSPSSQGDYGTIFVSQATLPAAENRGTNAPARGGTNAPSQRGGAGGGRGGARGPTYYSLNAPPMPAQVALAVEDYNRLVRMIQDGAKVKMAANLQVEYQNKDPMAYNTIAEIPGTDLKDEIVMLGGHMDSWQGGTGATDNGAGVAASMEVVRILKALKLQPRRTIRVGLWSGEEEGLLGSRAYVSQHFGTSTNHLPEYEKLSAYFNLDNGGGKIRGIYLQGNANARDLFTRWLEPFHDMGAETVTIQNTQGTDHLSFDGIGLPGFQFIQDTLDYNSRTHHSNEDVYDRIQPDDLKECATIMAAFVYNAAMMDEKVPRKQPAE